MTDLNKEREAFEKLSEIAEILNEEKSHFNGDFYDLPFNSCAESFINGAWYAWQEKAKAQAVPEGYVLVPKVANKKMVNAGYEAHDGFYTNGQVQDVYQAMIKAIESGAEQ
ncbi:hypothetical protein MSG72_01205 [Acinetobacter sp. IK22]|uniref:hypothetical protein n=1 Tax=unclassified Acinetobacter TaxID=196816 RepID=UPI002D1EC8C1|nr:MULTISPECIES: hypothetical protein [unclassified Acinetobacter]MEB3793704.1 hypothetical protein [Acinetobacter sp. IK24]MEB3812926.1 hypothetical protein [Acinetobacter sp. IK22]MEB3832100.1 hypothetical protein [Acinetobacter sp. IK23]